MSIHLKPGPLSDQRPRITVIGVGGAGGNALNNMIEADVAGVDFIAANTDAQELSMSIAGVRLQLGLDITEGLGAGLNPDIGAVAAEEALDDIRGYLEGVNILFITAGMGGGTGTGAAPVIARAAKDMGILTIAVVTTPFKFEGQRRMKYAEKGIADLAAHVDTVLVIPNQNLFRIASKTTTFADAFERANDVLRSGVSCITELMMKEGLIDLGLEHIKAVMQDMGTIMLDAGEPDSESGALGAGELAVSNLLLADGAMRGADGLLTSIIGNNERLVLHEVSEAEAPASLAVGAESLLPLNAAVTLGEPAPRRAAESVAGDTASDGWGDSNSRLSRQHHHLHLHGNYNVDTNYQTEPARRAKRRIDQARTVAATVLANIAHSFSRFRDKNRSAFERMLQRIKDVRRIALRHEAQANNYLTGVCLVATVWYFL
jgi:cell division protein FtsZ